MINNELKKLIESKPITFCTVNKEINSHTIYVLYVKVISENEILITDNYIQSTKNNFLFNENVSLSVLDGDVAFELKGKVKYFDSRKFF